MPRIKTQKARKPLKCSRCGATIKAGDEYRKFKRFRSPKVVRCMKSECAPRASELTGSSSRSAIYSANEQGVDGLAGATCISDLQSVRDDVVAAIEEAAEACREAASNIEDGFQHETEQSQQLNELADAVDSWKDEVEQVDLDDTSITVECQRCGAQFDIDVESGPDASSIEEHFGDESDCEDDESETLSKDELKQATIKSMEELAEEKFDELKSELEDAINNIPEA